MWKGHLKPKRSQPANCWSSGIHGLGGADWSMSDSRFLWETVWFSNIGNKFNLTNKIENKQASKQQNSQKTWVCPMEPGLKQVHIGLDCIIWFRTNIFTLKKKKIPWSCFSIWLFKENLVAHLFLFYTSPGPGPSYFGWSIFSAVKESPDSLVI